MSSESRAYRGRVAPTPTGDLHSGHARTFWQAYQRAIENEGVLIYREEDLDAQRCKREYAESAIADLAWLGIEWSEGPDVAGPHAPYRQSERHASYLAVWSRLKNDGFLYPCDKSRKDVSLATQAPHEEEEDYEPVFPVEMRGAIDDAKDFETPASMNWRFKVPDGETISFVDKRLGPVAYTAGEDFGDFLVWRRDSVPAYELAVVADDIVMDISEVVRGEDLLKSTARQILLYRALGASMPDFYHCELVRDEDGKRLAKRHDSLSIKALREHGSTPSDLR